MRLRIQLAAWVLLAVLSACSTNPSPSKPPVSVGTPRSPNIILVVADDLGARELGCYGQRLIRTPRIDALAREGVRLTDFNSAAPVCAPSRAMLLTGLHAGHASVRDNREVGPEGQQPLARTESTISQDLKTRGYATALFGKWGLGGPGSGSEPGDFGFDRFAGYLCQRKAHNHYPTSLWNDRTPLPLPGNDPAKRAEVTYAHDVIRDAALDFVKANRDQPFFMVFASPLPHCALQVPPAELATYVGAFPETPYDGKKGYLPHPTPHAAYAAMITRFDRDVGAIVDAVKAAGLQRDTIVLVTSDNGATHDVGGVDTAFFQSVGDLRGRKGGLFEGGVRVPFVAWSPGRIAPGRTLSDFAWMTDLRATIDGWAGATPPDTDGRDLGPWLAGTASAPPAARGDCIAYWETAGYGAQQSVRFSMNDHAWKAIRTGMDKSGTAAPLMLFDLATDPNEQSDVAASHPAEVARARELLVSQRKPSAAFPMPGLDRPDPIGPLPTAAQRAWQHDEFNAFIHFGPNTFTDREWGQGDEPESVFNPTALDARQWVRVLKQAGVKGVVITAKHHDGFCLWPTAFSKHSVKASPWKHGQGDVLRELSTACREVGLKFGVYLSPWDRNNPAYGTGEPYNEIFRAQLREVLTNYGPIHEVWFDGACGEGPNGKKQVYDFPSFEKVVRELQPNAVIFSDVGPDIRWVGNEQGRAGDTNWCMLNTKGHGRGADNPPSTRSLTEGDENGDAWIPAECDVSIRPGWFHHDAEVDKVKTPEQLFDLWERSVGHNANLLLNFPVDRRGLIHENDAAAVLGLRRLIDATYGPGTDLVRSRRDVRADDRTCTIELHLDSSRPFDRVALSEPIELGQRVRRFRISARVSDDAPWQPLAEATTIGHRRIVRVPATRSSGLRIEILDARGQPIVQAVSAHVATAGH